MDGTTISGGRFTPGWTAITVPLAVAATLLCLDGQLGPLSFTLRRTIALVVLVAAACLRIGRNERLPIVGWAALVATTVLVARAPSVPVALLAFVLGLTAMEIGSKSSASTTRIPASLVLACLSYVALRFVFDLVPQAGLTTEVVERCAERYLRIINGADGRSSFTALGGPAVGLSVLYLLWSWRGAGGIVRPVAAVAIPLAWFATLAVRTPEASAGLTRRLFSKHDARALLAHGCRGRGRLWGKPAARFRQCRAGSTAPRWAGGGLSGGSHGRRLPGRHRVSPHVGGKNNSGP